MPLSDPELLIDRAARKRRRTFALLAASNLLVALLLAVLVYAGLSGSRASVATQARVVAEGMAAIAQANIGTEFGKVDAVLRLTAGEIARMHSGPIDGQSHVQRILVENLQQLPGVEALRVTNADGIVRWGNDLPVGAQPDVSDRDYFQQARRSQGDRTIVVGPVQSRLSGHWVIGLARPLMADGEFQGIVYATIASGHFLQLFERYDLAQMDAMTLRGDDLRLVARRSPGSAVQGEIGSTTVSAELRAQLARDPVGGAYSGRVAVDGVTRTTAYRAVNGWPFIVFAGIAEDRFFAPWTRQAWTISLLAVLSWLLVALATFIVYRASLRESRAMQALAGQSLRTQALLRIAGDGIHIIDREGRLIEMSDSFAEMLQSTREEMMGRPVWSWDVNQNEAQVRAWLGKVRNGDKQRIFVQHRREDGSVIDVELQIRASELDGQLVIFGSSRDVTEQKRLQREQAAMLDSDLVAMVKLEDRKVVWRNRAMERLFGFGPGELAGQPMRMLYENDESYEKMGQEAYPVMQQGREYRTRVRMRRKDGDAVWVDLSGVRLSDTQTFFMAVDITATMAAHDELRRAALHDPLTALPNRLLLAERLEQTLATAAREGSRVAVAFLDLDGFKGVNDEFGHDVGDGVLVEVARQLRQSIRPSDTAARLGGDEFVLVLAGVRKDEWRPVLDRVVEAVSRPIVLSTGHEVSVGVSMGVALSGIDETAAEALIARADVRMLSAKRAGKGFIVAEG